MYMKGVPFFNKEYRKTVTQTKVVTSKWCTKGQGVGHRGIARWSVARAFPPGRFLNLILAHRGEVYSFNEARH